MALAKKRDVLDVFFMRNRLPVILAILAWAGLLASADFPYVNRNGIQGTIYGAGLFLAYFAVFDTLLRSLAGFSRRLRVLYSIIAVSRGRLLNFVLRRRHRWLFVLGFLVIFIFGVEWQWIFETPADPEYQYRGELFATFCMLIWLMGYVAPYAGYPSLTTGIPQTARIKRLSSMSLTFINALQLLLIVILGLLCSWLFGPFPGPYASFGMAAVLLQSVLAYQIAIVDISKVRRALAPQARELAQRSRGETSVVLFLSDIHLTEDGTRQASGHPSGNTNLEILASRLSIRPNWIVVAGDLVETGRTTEWNLAAGMLRRFRERGIRILLAPGNHDLSSAYDEAATPIITEGWSNYLYVTSITNYLQNASLLEPELTSHDGRKLTDIWKKEVAPVNDLEHRWQRACELALQDLNSLSPSVDLWLGKGRKPKPRALRNLSLRSPAKATLLIDSLIDDAISLLHTPNLSPQWFSKSHWTDMLLNSPHCLLDPIYKISKWKPLCYDIFPLTFVDKKEGIEFMIVNSNVPEPGLIGSAFGELTEPQIDRLRLCVAASTQPVIVVLMHHPICRWADDMDRRASINRWAFLAHHSEEARTLPSIICAAAPRSCRLLLLCGGHVHDIARIGRIVSNRGTRPPRNWKRLLILENPALPNLGYPDREQDNGRSNDLLMCERSADGRLSPVLVRWPDLLTPVEGRDQIEATGNN